MQRWQAHEVIVWRCFRGETPTDEELLAEWRHEDRELVEETMAAYGVQLSPRRDTMNFAFQSQ